MMHSKLRTRDVRELKSRITEGIRRARKLGPRIVHDPVDRIELRRFAGHALHAGQLIRPIRVAHLTDLHVGRITPMKVQLAAVELANRQQPDLVALTGDFVCHGHAYLKDLAIVLSRFEAPMVAVLGNHDHWSGAAAVVQVLTDAGVTLLSNENTVISVNGQSLQIVGVDDAYTSHADVSRALTGLRAGLATIGLSHIAEEAEPLWRGGVPLVLSGHTHAGQITLARLNEIVMGRVAGYKYMHGLYGSRVDGPPSGAVYVGAGIGAGMMPLRIGDRARREVTIFEIGVPPGAIDEHHEEQTGRTGRPPSARARRRRAARVTKKHRQLEKRQQRKDRRPRRIQTD